jgi:hypothetical protein
VQLLLRAHGFRRAPPLVRPRLRRHLRRSWFARNAPGAQAADGDAHPVAVSGGGEDGAPWSVEWRTGRIDPAEVHRLLPWQRVNKFPAISSLTLKAQLWRHYDAMVTAHGAEHYGYMPRTFVLPDEYEAWVAARRHDAQHTPVWIVKPNHASRGCGISLLPAEGAEVEGTNEGTASTADATASASLASMHGVACAYVHPPLLLDERKFDVRLYVLITSWHPLCVYLYHDGLARFATAPYALSPDTLGGGYGAADGVGAAPACGRTHLTNYSLNESGQRMMLDELDRRLCAEVGSDAASRMWRAVDDLVVKMALSVEQPVSKALASSSLRIACGHPNTQVHASPTPARVRRCTGTSDLYAARCTLRAVLRAAGHRCDVRC